MRCEANLSLGFYSEIPNALSVWGMPPSHVQASCVNVWLELLYPECYLCNILYIQMVKRWVVQIAVGDRVHHFKTGRAGTVVERLENGWQIKIEFDKFNAAGMRDGQNEMRNRYAFNVGPAPGVDPCLST